MAKERSSLMVEANLRLVVSTYEPTVTKLKPHEARPILPAFFLQSDRLSHARSSKKKRAELPLSPKCPKAAAPWGELQHRHLFSRDFCEGCVIEAQMRLNNLGRHTSQPSVKRNILERAPSEHFQEKDIRIAGILDVVSGSDLFS